MKLYFLIVLAALLRDTEAFRNGFCNAGHRVSKVKHTHLSMVQSNVAMPALSSTMTSGKIVSWAKKVGDKVSSGDVLLVVESDKADMDVEAYEDGYLAKIITPEGGTAAVGDAVAIIVSDKSEIGNVGAAAPTGGAVATQATTTTQGQAATTSSTSGGGAAKPAGCEGIMMPALSSTMTSGKIVSWGKKVGDKVNAGDMVLVVESDKADMDVESYDEGYLAAIITPEGESANVGTPVAFLAKTKDDIAAVQAYVASMNGGGGGGGSGGVAAAVGHASSVGSSSSTSGSPPSSPTSSTPSASTPRLVTEGRVASSGYAKKLAKEQGIDLRTIQPSRADGLVTSKDLIGAVASSSSSSSSSSSAYVPTPGTINASPMARKYAAEYGLDVTKIKGSGNFGRVTGDDVLIAAGKKVAVSPPKPEPVATTTTTQATQATSSKAGKSASASAVPEVLDGVKPMDSMQKAVAKNMEKTLSVPIFRVSREIVTDNFDALYAQLKPKGVTVSAMLAKAVAEVLKKHPIVNAAYVEGGIKYNKDVNVAMAVAIDGGLITPTIIAAQNQDLFSISRTWKELVDKAKAKKLTPAEYSSGTFTISNLGMFGVQQFDAILPPGTGSILAIAASTPKVVQLKNGFFGVQKSMTVTITCDHRHIYGADAAEFLKDLADLIENQTMSLVMG